MGCPDHADRLLGVLPAGRGPDTAWAGLPDLRAKPACRRVERRRDGHRFTCRLGLRNHWFPIQLRDETLGLAYLQALDRLPVGPPARKRSARAPRARFRRADAKVLSRLEFARAARFLQHIVQHAQTASLSDLRKADLTSAGRAVLALEQEQARLHLALQPTPSARSPGSPPLPARNPTPEQTVRGLLERIELDYRKPLTLQHYARELGMNAAYLSALFSHAVGVPFKTHLTELRMAKAKELLGDPAKTVSEAAEAVGYASGNRFRLAFKKATGLSPELWRETMQPNPLPLSPSI